MAADNKTPADIGELVKVIRRIQYLLIPASIAAVLLAASEVWMSISFHLPEKEEEEPKAKVIVTVDDLVAGQVISITNLAAKSFPTSSLPEGYIEIRDVRLVLDQVLVQPKTNMCPLSWYDFKAFQGAKAPP